MSRTALLILGLLGEKAAILALFTDQRVWSRLLLFLTGHLTASGCLSRLLSGVLEQQSESKHWCNYWLFFSFAFFIPVFGCVGMLVALVYFRYFLHFEVRDEFSNVSLPPFMLEGGVPSPGMGVGGAWSRLRTPTLHRSVRLKALLAVGDKNGRNSGRLLQLATCDNDDEIRLLAFNLLDRRETLISRPISQAMSEMSSTTDPTRRIQLCRKLAFSYWEMVFNYLAENELADFFIHQALSYAKQALVPGEEDSNLLVLMGRLHLWLNDFDEAEKIIQKSLEQGAHRDRVIPYLAELAYHRKDYQALMQYFEHDPLLRYKPGIGPVAKFWQAQSS